MLEREEEFFYDPRYSSLDAVFAILDRRTQEGNRVTGPLTADELEGYADAEPTQLEVERLQPFGRTFAVKEGDKNVSDAIAIRAVDLIDGEPDVLVVISRDGRTLVVKPDGSSDNPLYEAAAKPGGRTVMFEGADPISRISNNPGKIGAASVMHDSLTDQQAGQIRSALLRQLAQEINSQTALVNQPGVEKPLFSPVEAGSMGLPKGSPARSSAPEEPGPMLQPQVAAIRRRVAVRTLTA